MQKVLALLLLFGNGAGVVAARKNSCATGYSEVAQDAYGYSYFLTTDCTGQEYTPYGNWRTWDKGGCYKDGGGDILNSHSQKAPMTGNCGVQTVNSVQLVEVAR